MLGSVDGYRTQVGTPPALPPPPDWLDPYSLELGEVAVEVSVHLHTVSAVLRVRITDSLY